MKYMNANSSCSFCCIANMVEEYQINIDDIDIVKDAGLAYRFHYDPDTDTFYTGMMLQRVEDYNRFLNKYGLEFVEVIVTRQEVLSFLRKNAPCMIGIDTDTDKHAMIFLECNSKSYKFLNPHREEDGQEDYLFYSEEDLLKRVGQNNKVGYIQKLTIEPDHVVDRTIERITFFKKRFIDFCTSEQTNHSIRANLNTLLRCIALDLPRVMELTEYKSFLKKLKVLQDQIFRFIKSSGGIPADFIDLNLFGEVISDYEVIVKARNHTISTGKKTNL